MKRPQVIMVAAAAIILGLFWFTYTIHREPRYNGKSLSEWLRLNTLRLHRRFPPSGRPVESQEAAPDAVRHIGTNALPFLVDWIRKAEDMSPNRQRFLEIVWNWPLDTPGRELLLESIGGRQFRAYGAGGCFEILGESARGAVPDLARVAREGKSPSSGLAIGALSYLGNDALPPILSMITNADLQVRRQAFSSLCQMGYLGTNAHPAIALLIQCLQNPGLAKDAAYALGKLHLESDIAVPALIECTSSTNRGMRERGVSGLEEFGPEARAAVPQLTKLLSDPEDIVRQATTNALRLVAPDVLQKSSAP